MEVMGLFPSSLIFLLFSTISNASAVTTCPNTLTVEKGSNYNMTCTSDENVNDFYWYKGTAKERNLVGKLENGITSVSQRYQNSYDITPSGSLEIRNAGLSHESLYTLVTFDLDGIPEEDEVVLNITISPDPSCPMINDCTPCVECLQLDSKGFGTLVCRVERIRPLLPLRWNTTSQTGVSFVKYQQVNTQDKSADSWNISLTLNYELMMSCGVKIVLYCLAEDTAQILETTISKVEITNGPCNPPQPTESSATENFRSGVSPVIVVILIVLVLIVVMFTACCILRKRRNSALQDRAGATFPDIDCEENQEVCKEILDQLVGELKKLYQQQCNLQPLPNGPKIPLSAVFTESECTLKNAKGQPTVKSSQLLEHWAIRDEKRVAFFAEHGFGRTTFAKTILQQWIASNEHHFTLVIFIPLKMVTEEMKLSDVVKECLPKGSRLKANDIERILKLKTGRCLLILDGLEDISKSAKEKKMVRADKGDKTKPYTEDILKLPRGHEYEKSNSADGGGCRDKLIPGPEKRGNEITIDDILTAREKSHHLHVWVTSRKVDFMNSLSEDWLEHGVKVVTIRGFTKEQVQTYIQKCCSYYINYRDPTRSFDNSNDYCEKQSQAVESFLAEHGVFKDFAKTPILINLMIHILSGKYTSAVNYLQATEINNMTILLRNVIDCMEERYLKKKNSSSRKQISRLENKLGEIAYEYNMMLGEKERSFWEERIGAHNVTVAEEIGLLKLTENTVSSTTPAKEWANTPYIGIRFYHPSIQEFFGALYTVKNHDKSFENETKRTTKRALQFINELQS